jgi:hypothetical protein
VAVDGWQWQGGSEKKMEGFGPVLTEIWVIDWQWQWQWVAVAVGGSGWVAVAGWQWEKNGGIWTSIDGDMGD